MKETVKIEKKMNYTNETLICTPDNARKDSKIIFIHGWGLSNKSYKEVITNISEKNSQKVYALALPGFGESSSLGGNTTIDNIVEKLSSQIENLKQTKNTHLVGHSFGSYLILKMLSKNLALNPNTTTLFNPVGFHSKNAEYYTNFTLSLLSELKATNVAKIQDGTSHLLKNPVNLIKLAKIALEANITTSLLEDTQTSINFVLSTHDKITPVNIQNEIANLPNVAVQYVEGNHGFILKNPIKSSEIVQKIIEN